MIPTTTLIFDFGGVIINLDLAQCIRNLERIGVRNPQQYLSNYGQTHFFLKWEKGEIDIQTFRNEIRKISDNSPTDEAIDQAWCSFLQDIPASRIQLLLQLKKKFRLVLLSNSNPLHIEHSAKKEFAKFGLDIRHVFDACYFSYELGMAKPDMAIFQRLLSDENVAPAQCLFLDDGPKNIAMAEQLGIPSMLVTQGQNLDFLLTE